jgi:hypothetical protein
VLLNEGERSMVLDVTAPIASPLLEVSDPVGLVQVHDSTKLALELVTGSSC